MERHIKKKILNVTIHISAADVNLHPEALEDLQDRYEAIGGISPLAKITQQQTESLGKALE